LNGFSNDLWHAPYGALWNGPSHGLFGDLLSVPYLSAVWDNRYREFPFNAHFNGLILIYDVPFLVLFHELFHGLNYEI
jgi:hypothetical protein